LQRNDFSTAEQHYLAVLKLQPDNASVLNNLAWVSGKQHKKEAIAYAERAVALAPNQPNFLDTLAALNAEKGDYAKALQLQARALALQPKNPLFKLNLARINLQAGNKQQAKEAVQEMSALGDQFPEQSKLMALRHDLAMP
jgi:tetratricopeptide (TPR) repeat protein